MSINKLPFIVMPAMPFVTRSMGNMTIVTIGKFHFCRSRIVYANNCKGWEIVF